MSTKLASTRKQMAYIDMCILQGKPPYDKPTNASYGDPYFAKSLVSKYGMSLYEIAEQSGFADKYGNPYSPENDVATLDDVVQEHAKVLPKTEVPLEIQSAVDRYIELSKMRSEIEKEMKTLRNIVEPYMEANEIAEIKGTKTGMVAIEPRNMPPISAIYTSYNIDLIKVLPTTLKKQCVVEVIDREKVEALDKLGKLPDGINLPDWKVNKVTNCFIVK